MERRRRDEEVGKYRREGDKGKTRSHLPSPKPKSHFILNVKKKIKNVGKGRKTQIPFPKLKSCSLLQNSNPISKIQILLF
jgi:hypothetical protein